MSCALLPSDHQYREENWGLTFILGLFAQRLHGFTELNLGFTPPDRVCSLFKSHWPFLHHLQRKNQDPLSAVIKSKATSLQIRVHRGVCRDTAENKRSSLNILTSLTLEKFYGGRLNTMDAGQINYHESIEFRLFLADFDLRFD